MIFKEVVNSVGVDMELGRDQCKNQIGGYHEVKKLPKTNQSAQSRTDIYAAEDGSQLD